MKKNISKIGVIATISICLVLLVILIVSITYDDTSHTNTPQIVQPIVETYKYDKLKFLHQT